MVDKTSITPVFLDLIWKGQEGYPIMINIRRIESLRTPSDGTGCTIKYGSGDSCTVTASYESVRAALALHGTIIKL